MPSAPSGPPAAPSAGRPPYRPDAAARSDRRSQFRQFLALPRTLSTLYCLIREDFRREALDRHLWSFRGFFDHPDDPYCRLRPWAQASLKRVDPAQVTGMPPGELAFLMHTAMEIEQPILEYSSRNAEGFRCLLPAIARFMGKAESVPSAAGHWCESPWCGEERRHASTFARLIQRLTGETPGVANPNQPRATTATEEDALQLLLSREAAEWNSSSTYTVMAAHAQADLHLLLRNIARDEIKHLAILSAARHYLLGLSPWNRLRDLVRQSLTEYRGQKQARTCGSSMSSNPITAVEVIASHLFVEWFLGRWLRSIPVTSLEWIFEGDLPGTSMQEGATLRRNLSRWPRRFREKAIVRREFQEAHRGEIEDAVRARRKRARGLLAICVRNRIREEQIRSSGSNRGAGLRQSPADPVRRA